ncbi:MAG: secretin N-terminal domain-containing protein [Pirellulales bacterium]
MAKHSWYSQQSHSGGLRGVACPEWAFVLALVLALPVSAQQPATPATAPGENRLRETAEPYLSSYALPADKKQAAGDIVQQFSNNAAGRVAYDVRTGQLIVYGPAAFHQQLQQLLAAPTQAPPPAVRRLPAAGAQAAPPAVVAPPIQDSEAPPADAGGSRGVRLRTLDAAGLHARIEQLVARPLPATWDASNEWLSFPLTAGAGAEASINIHRASGEVRLQGDPATVASWQRVISALDSPPAAGNRVTRLASTRHAPQDQLRRTLQVLSNQLPASVGVAPPDQRLAMLLQQPEPPVDQPAPIAEPPVPVPAPGTEPLPPAGEAPAGDEASTLLGPVRIEFVEGLDVIVVEGNQRDVERVLKIIEQIESLSAETMPAIEIVPLENVDSVSLAQLLTQVYERVLGPRTGTVSITPLGRPNALLLIGRIENVQRATELVKRLDQPVGATSRFEFIPLKYAAAEDVKVVIDQFLQEQQQQEAQPQQTPPITLAPRALVVADYRSNALIVRASPRDMTEIKAVIERLDTNQVAAIDEVRVFQLANTVAPELAETLRGAIAGQIAPGQPGEPGQAPTGSGARSTALQFIMIDAETQQRLQSGILTNVRISADQRANAIVVTAPPDSMSLIAALIAQLDRAPTAEAELKVFTIANGDAQSLADMLRGLFSPTEGQVEGGGGLGGAAGALVPLQFSVDARTNSIIVAGSAEDLAVVEAILLRLDSSDMRQRTTAVYRLKNAPAEDVAIALNEWLRTEREAEAAAELAISPFEQIEREVVIVPELVSNSLIVSATPRFFEEIRKLIEQLDERPPMVMIQVLIAEVEMGDLDEFGVELGLQDSILFDRSAISPVSDFLTVTNSTQTQGAGGAVTTVTEQRIVNQPLNPGFNFNNVNDPLGNNGSTSALATAGKVAAQGLSNFGVGRVSPNSDFGGFVFSASSNSVNFLLRALQEKRRLEILSRPQIMALDNQEGVINVGQLVPRVASVNQTQFGQTNSVVYEQVGIILRVRPRISPDGLVVMEIYANKSNLTDSTVPISVGEGGVPLTAQIIRNLEAQTTVSANSGQTVVLSGLLTKETLDIHRRVPLISDIPLIGDLFRYDSVQETRTELLIILTPRIVRDHLDAEMIKQVESSRMSWVLCDVITMHGPSGLRSRCDEWGDGETCAVYPTHVPAEGDVIPLTPPEGPGLPLMPTDPNLPEAPLSEFPRPMDEQIAPAGYGYDGQPPKEVRYAMEK